MFLKIADRFADEALERKEAACVHSEGAEGFSTIVAKWNDEEIKRSEVAHASHEILPQS